MLFCHNDDHSWFPFVLLYPIVGNYLSNRERSQAELAYDQTMEETSEEEKRAIPIGSEIQPIHL